MQRYTFVFQYILVFQADGFLFPRRELLFEFILEALLTTFPLKKNPLKILIIELFLSILFTVFPEVPN